MPRFAHGFMLAALVSFSLACPSKPEPAAESKPTEVAPEQPIAATPEPEPEPPPETPPASPPSPLAEHMRDHFGKAAQLELEVVDGALDNARAQAKALHESLTTMAVPDSWKPHVDRMLAAADEAAQAKDLVAAARATGQVIHGCGSCHAAVGSGPKYGELTPVPEGETTQARMARHEWAAARMREGMIGPSEQRWLAGAKAVSVAPPEPCPIPSDDILSKDILDLREKIYEIGAQAAETHEPEARAVVYGEYLTTCAGCHVGGC